MFVKNLKESVTEEDLKKFFDGETITEIRLPKKRDGLCKGWVFCSIYRMLDPDFKL